MLKIINDTGLNIACDIKVGDGIFNYRHGDGAVSYDIDSDSKADIEIVKEDIWASNEPYSSLFFIPYTFDLVFGNMSDAENLPLTISYKGILNEDNSTVYLSKIIGINQNSLRRWSKYASIQCHFASILVLILGILLSFVFNGWIQLLFVLLSVISAVGIMILVLYKKKALLKRLKKLMIQSELTGMTRIELLKKYADYDRSKHNLCENRFVLGGIIPEILNKYRYYDYINGLDKGSDEIAFKLLDFVCDNFGHNGMNGLGSGVKITDLITFCESNDMKTNCRGLAILLASLLRLNGIKAQHITCMPYEEPFDDCHVVVDCLLPSGKRIMLDPTSRLFYKDKNGEYVSLAHLREMLIAGEPIFSNPTASYNGGEFNQEENRNYMIKNTFRFARCTLNQEGIDGKTGNSRYIELIPCNYSIDFYSIENYPEQRKDDFVYNDIDFWKM